MAWAQVGAVVAVDKETLINTINANAGTAVHGADGQITAVEVVTDPNSGFVTSVRYTLAQ